MITAGENADVVFFDLIDEAVLLVDAAGPAAGKFVPERLGFAAAGKRITLNLLDELDNSQGFFSVLFHPPRQIFKCVGVKRQAFCTLRQEECLSFDFLHPAAAFSSPRF